MSSIPAQLTGVTALTKANVYFDGKVVSHTLLGSDGTRQTLGLIYPGTYHFGTGAPERMEIVDGACRVRLDGSTQETTYRAGDRFEVPGQSGFDIAVDSGLCQYLCTFL